MSDRRIIGLTGGIATGKTTVANYLSQCHHLPIFDADIYARQAVEPGSPVLAEIAQRYGDDILFPDGTLNRSRLGDIIFNDASQRRWLEAQIHPYVRDSFVTAIRQATSFPVVLVVPLLFEAGMTDLVTEIWVVSCPPEMQLQRLIQRDNLTREAAQARIDSQMPLREKCDRADVVLDNTVNLEALQRQIDRELA